MRREGDYPLEVGTLLVHGKQAHARQLVVNQER